MARMALAFVEHRRGNLLWSLSDSNDRLDSAADSMRQPIDILPWPPAVTQLSMEAILLVVSMKCLVDSIGHPNSALQWGLFSIDGKSGSMPTQTVAIGTDGSGDDLSTKAVATWGMLLDPLDMRRVFGHCTAQIIEPCPEIRALRLCPHALKRR